MAAATRSAVSGDSSVSGFVGPTDETRRSLVRVETWVGLAPGERALLEKFVRRLEVKPAELHTHVPVGMCEVDMPAVGDRMGRKLMASLWPRRVDCALRFDDAWWLIESKVGCAHYVLGQCLCYAYWWRRDCPECELKRVIVVTDKCQDDVAVVLAEYGVDLVEVGCERRRTDLE